ncbi:hypothetical protein EJ06DRAFT_533231 [Trichodelitschia bisporula]|uniref:Uncharacterized protein n=1 Tax=Trichodelitschia bisporula TaxID=703511 RepID=A0A6G1HM10_9PEZI|nr:hypothetical protein EJ06DRAFT_533231 [Trichodelitschia bisporula]
MESIAVDGLIRNVLLVTRTILLATSFAATALTYDPLLAVGDLLPALQSLHPLYPPERGSVATSTWRVQSSYISPQRSDALVKLLTHRLPADVA